MNYPAHDMSYFRTELKECTKLAGMEKNKQIAKTIGVREDTFSDWINGHRFSHPLGRKILLKICIALMQNEKCSTLKQKITDFWELARSVPVNNHPTDRKQKKEWEKKADKLEDLYQLPNRCRLPIGNSSKKRELRDLEIKFLDLWEKMCFTAN